MTDTTEVAPIEPASEPVARKAEGKKLLGAPYQIAFTMSSEILPVKPTDPK